MCSHWYRSIARHSHDSQTRDCLLHSTEKEEAVLCLLSVFVIPNFLLKWGFRLKLVCLQITVSESRRTWEGEQLGDDLVKVVKPFDGVHRFHIAVLPCDQRQQHRRA